MIRAGHPALVSLAAVAAGLLPGFPAVLGDASTEPTPGPRFDRAFWDLWADGQAELAGYELLIPRYGQTRRGVAVSIFVTEHFHDDDRVKAEGAGDYPVMKLNLIKDFQTGIYDYNVMSSVFVNLEAAGQRPPGTVSKVSFSSQEWCGHVYQQLLFDATSVRKALHSYFEGEADRSGRIEFPVDGLPADALFHWARGFSEPVVQPGAQRRVPVLTSLETARFEHVAVKWSEATLSRSAGTETVTVPSGTFTVNRATAELPGDRSWTFYIEQQPPHRIIKWRCSNGEQAELLGSERLKYWKMNAEGQEQALQKLGLDPTGARR